MSSEHSPTSLSAIFGAEGQLLSRLLRVFQLDDSVYAEIQDDVAAIPQAFVIVIATSVLVGLGQASLHGMFLGIASACVLWLVATGLLWLAGSIVVGDRTDYVPLLRCTGFAYAWFSLMLFGSLPLVGWIVGWAAVALCFTSLVIATRRILETTTGQALGICAVALGLPVLIARCLGA
jgi:hypothetical protein